MAQKEDYYKILGVEKNASDGDIKRAYKRLAKKYHPDLNPDNKEAEEMFKKVNEAYTILGDSEKRAQYDRFGHAAFEGGAGFGGFSSGFGGFEDIFGDIFGDFFGGGSSSRSRRRAPRRGDDLAFEYEIDFMDAVKGVQKEITIEKIDRCPICGGSGEEEANSRRTCSTCGGSGRVHVSQGFFSISQTCPNCHGEGEIIEKPCKNCGGRGLIRKEKKLSVNIPRGVYTGARLRLEGEGNAGPRGAEYGDLHIVIKVRPHELFKRENDDIFYELPISFTQAALGDEVEVPTIYGKEKIEIKPGTQCGDRIKLKGKGVENLRGYGRGDQIITFYVETPTNLTARQKELLQEFAELSGKKVHPKSESFLEKVKKFFTMD